MCNLCKATDATAPDPYFPVVDFRHRTLKRFVIAIRTSLPRQLLRAKKTFGISKSISQQVQIEILLEKREELLTARCVVFEKPYP